MNRDQLWHLDPDNNLNIINENADIFNCKYTSVDTFQTIKQNFSNGLSLICFNIRSFMKNSDEFLSYLTLCKHSFDIIVLTETWGKDETHTLLHIPGYNSLHNYRKNKKGGGVSIFIKNTYKYMPVDEFDISEEALESIAATVYYPNSSNPVNVLGIYRPPNSNINDTNSKLREILTSDLINNKDTIITGDFNVCLLQEDHSVHTSNFMNMMREFFFRPLITRPTRFQNNTATVIDHIWTNITYSTDNYIFYCDITDHCPIFCRVNIPIALKNELVKIKFRDMCQSNKDRFVAMLRDTNWNEVLDGLRDTNSQLKKLIETLENYYNICFPVRTKIIGMKRLSKPWITEALHKSIYNKHLMYKLVRQNLYDDNRYKIYTNTLNTLIRASRAAYYKEQFQLCKSDIKRTWNIINTTIKPGKRYSSIMKLYHNNHEINDPTQIAETLNNHFTGIGIALKNALPTRHSNAFRRHLPAITPNSIYLNPSTSSEVKNVIMGLKNVGNSFKSVSTKLLKENSVILSDPISYIFNNIINSGQYPDMLKIACVTAVFKSGDKTNPNNYRPISTLSNLNKVFEKLLHIRLYSFFESRGIICKEQYGFRKKKSTSDAVNEFLSKVYKAMSDKKYLGAVFLDLSKAFDTVNHDILLKKLEHYGIRGLALNLLKSYLTNRKQYVTVDGNKSQTQEMTIGVPQGSVLGPLLFLIYINDLPLSIKKMNAILFADDTTLFTSHSDLNTLSKNMSDDLQMVSEWLIANQLTLNISKTHYIIFSTREVPNNLQITIGQHTLERQKSGKFLGVILDEKLTFKEHISAITVKVSKVVGLFYRLKNLFPLDVIYKLYYSLVYPHLNYCILAWGSAKQTFLNPLVILQKRICRIITGSPYYAHSGPLFQQLKLLRVDDLYLLQCQLYMYSTLVLNKYPDFKDNIMALQQHHNYHTRCVMLRNVFCRIEVCKQSLLHNTIHAWNLLTEDVKNINMINSFKNACKLQILRRY